MAIGRRGRAVLVVAGLVASAVAGCGGGADTAAPASSTTSDRPSTTHVDTRGRGTATSVAPRVTMPAATATSTPAGPTGSPPTTVSSPPTTSAAASATGGSGRLDGRVVVLDPGHNGANARHTAEIGRLVDIGNGRKPCNTTGTASNDGYAESAFTFDVAGRVAALLRAAGARVVLTRDDDSGWGPCVDRRAAIANEAHADAAVSIHADGAAATSRGFHVIRPSGIAGQPAAVLDRSARLAQRLRSAFEPASGLPPSNYVGVDGLVARDDLGGLNLARVPAVFVECANMRNAADLAVLESSAGRDRIARGIAEGIAAFLVGG